MHVQLRSREAPEQTKTRMGKHPQREDFSILLSGDATIYKPDGKRLLVLRRNALSQDNLDAAYPFFHWVRRYKSLNRGSYAGEGRGRKVRKDGYLTNTSEAMPVPSAIVGYFNRYPRIPYCRETALATEKPEEWGACLPMIQEAARLFQSDVPDRYKAQLEAAKKSHPAYILPETCFTTVTVNNTFAGAYHVDKGDYAPGFGVMAVLRRGEYRGCELVFPGYGVAVDMQHGDLIFFDAHEVHGNTPFYAFEGKAGEDYERISVVMYLREKILDCLSPSEELERAKRIRGGITHDDELPDSDS